MSVETTTFGGVRLTGEDARRLQEAIDRAVQNQAAIESLRRARALRDEQRGSE